MNKQVFLLAISLLLFKISSSGQVYLDWVQTVTGNSVEFPYDIQLDDEGNIFIYGIFTDTIDCDPSDSSYLLYAKGEHDCFVAKLDVGGNFIWARSFGGTRLEYAEECALDSRGNVYVTGEFYGDIVFNHGEKEYSRSSAGETDIFMVKYSHNGDFLWAHTLGEKSYESAHSIHINQNDEVLLTGNFTRTMDFDPGPAIHELKFTGTFLLKLDSNGNFNYAKRIVSGLDRTGHSITTDAQGNIIVAGTFFNSFDADPSEKEERLVSVGHSDVYVMKLNPFGDYIWAKSFGSINGEGVSKVKTDHKGDLVLIGTFAGPVDFDPGPDSFIIHDKLYLHDGYILKLSTDGQFLWAHGFGNERYVNPHDVELDDTGNVYVTGAFDVRLIVDSIQNFVVNTNGGNDIFLFKLAPNGQYLWTRSMGGTGGDHSRGMDVDPYGNIFLTGSYAFLCDFDPTHEQNYFPTQGLSDGFVTKLIQKKCKASYGKDVHTACDSFTWINGITYFTSSDNATFTRRNSQGCDSIIQLQLTVNQVNKQVVSTDSSLIAQAVNAEYQWLDCQKDWQAIPNAEAKIYYPPKTGSYAVEVKQNNCVDTSDCFKIEIITPTIQPWTNLFPNPTKSSSNLVFRGIEMIDVRVCSMEGKIIQKESNIVGGIYQIQDPGASGIYIVEVEWDSGKAVYRLLKAGKE